MKKLLVGVVLLSLLAGVGGTWAQEPDGFIFGDPLPDAPELAARGPYHVGVQTLELVNPGQIDVLNASAEDPYPLYDRPLTVEVWYPGMIPADAAEIVTYEDDLGVANDPNRPLIPFSFDGRAFRDALPDASGGPYPLVIVSHGYPGSRLMFTYLTENLASKGYVVASIGHTESTYQDASDFTSTLYHRPLDILFVLDSLAGLGAEGSDSFLAGLVDAERTALIGYSMGGYGALNAAGAGLAPFAVTMFTGMAGTDALQARQAGNADFLASQDDRIKAVVAFAPWGMNLNLFAEDGLGGLTVPVFFVAGSHDDVAGYENGIVRYYEGAVNAERYLLTYENARHNVAPNPAPAAAFAPGLPDNEWLRYDDSVWDERRINNINQHFVTAFLGRTILGDESYAAYLDVVEEASDGVFKVDDAGNPTSEHTYWPGFMARTAVGLRLEHRAPGE